MAPKVSFEGDVEEPASKRFRADQGQECGALEALFTDAIESGEIASKGPLANRFNRDPNGAKDPAYKECRTWQASGYRSLP